MDGVKHIYSPPHQDSQHTHAEYYFIYTQHGKHNVTNFYNYVQYVRICLHKRHSRFIQPHDTTRFHNVNESLIKYKMDVC